MKAIARLFFVAAVLLIPACASSRANQGMPSEETTVIVDNQALLDMTVYALRGAQRVRLGLANGLSKTRFIIPGGLVFGSTSLRFQADPIGSNRSPISEEITVSEGEEVTLRIPPS